MKFAVGDLESVICSNQYQLEVQLFLKSYLNVTSILIYSEQRNYVGEIVELSEVNPCLCMY